MLGLLQYTLNIDLPRAPLSSTPYWNPIWSVLVIQANSLYPCIHDPCLFCGCSFFYMVTLQSIQPTDRTIWGIGLHEQRIFPKHSLNPQTHTYLTTCTVNGFGQNSYRNPLQPFQRQFMVTPAEGCMYAAKLPLMTWRQTDWASGYSDNKHIHLHRFKWLSGKQT